VQELTQAAKPPAIEFSAATQWELSGMTGNPAKPGLFKTQYADPAKLQAWFGTAARLNPAAKKVAFLSSDDSNAEAVVGKGAKPFFQAHGLEVLDVRYPAGTTDFSPYLTKIKAAHVDVLYTGITIVTDVVSIIRQAIEVDAAPAFMGFTSAPSVALSGAIGKPIKQPFIAGQASLNLENPTTDKVKAYRDEYVAKYGGLTSSSSVSLWYYDPTFMLIRALQIAGTVDDTAAIRKALLSLRWNGIQRWCWNDKQVALTEVEFALVTNGQTNWYKPAIPFEDCHTG
jgi:ABC-type branched-subunit amino acid transport system substrate-binding protein